MLEPLSIGGRRREARTPPQSAQRVPGYDRAATLIVSGEFWFLAMMLSCLAIEPSSLAVRRGLSYYGTSLATIVPYVLGFGVSITMTALGFARITPSDATGQRLRLFVAVVLALMLAIPLTPYSIDLMFDWLHVGAAAALFASGLALGGWITLHLHDRLSRTLYVLQSAAAISILAAQVGLNKYMIPSELWFQLTVFGLVLHATRGIANPFTS
jgi:hypothetical protein